MARRIRTYSSGVQPIRSIKSCSNCLASCSVKPSFSRASRSSEKSVSSRSRVSFYFEGRLFKEGRVIIGIESIYNKGRHDPPRYNNLSASLPIPQRARFHFIDFNPYLFPIIHKPKPSTRRIDKFHSPSSMMALNHLLYKPAENRCLSQ